MKAMMTIVTYNFFNPHNYETIDVRISFWKWFQLKLGLKKAIIEKIDFGFAIYTLH